MGDFATLPEQLPYLDRSWLNENIDTGSKKKEVYLLAFSSISLPKEEREAILSYHHLLIKLPSDLWWLLSRRPRVRT